MAPEMQHLDLFIPKEELDRIWKLRGREEKVAETARAYSAACKAACEGCRFNEYGWRENDVDHYPCALARCVSYEAEKKALADLDQAARDLLGVEE